MGKLFWKILHNRLSKLVEDREILGQIQFGFRKNKRGTDSIVILTQIMEYLKKKKKKGYLAFIDLRKAFDRVWRTGLWKCLPDLGIGNETIRILEQIYDNIRKMVEINSTKTDWFSSKIGVRQGCVMSPLLFSLYIQSIGTKLIDSRKGITMDGTVIPALFFADDMVLFSEKIEDLQQQLETLTETCEEKKLEINYDKTKIMCINDKDLTEWKLPTNQKT